jgi:N-acetylneuraminate lyase
MTSFSKGLYSAPFTPFQTDGKIKPDIIPAYAQKLKDDGVRGVFVNGTTGEGLSLSPDERMALTEAWMKEQSSSFEVMVNISSESVQTAQVLSRHARDQGAAAVGMMGPVFLGVNSAEQLADFCAEAAEPASDLPFYYYHIPGMSGVTVPMKDFLIAASQRIPQLAGIKFSHANLMELQQCLRLHDERYTVLFGCDEMLLAALVLGVHGAIGSTYNYMAPVYQAMLSAYQLATAKPPGNGSTFPFRWWRSCFATSVPSSEEKP